jgi:hypothetical protein
MELVGAWVLLPVVLGLLALGWGQLVALAAGLRPGFALLAPLGFAALVVVGGFCTLADATAELAAPVAVAGAVAGLALLARSRPSPPSAWGMAALAGAFAVYAAPIVLSGEPTFAGYIRLDDTATWLAFTDHLREHGRDLSGLALSTHEATLALNVGEGYPLGGFVVLGIAAELVPVDAAWLIQPYMAWLAVVLAASAWALARPLVASAPARAAVVFGAAQPALLFGYYLWGGTKEIAVAALVGALAACLGAVVRAGFPVRALIAPAAVCAAVLGILGEGGAIWLIPPAALAVVVALRRLPPATVAIRGGLGIALVAVLSLPVLAVGGLRPPTSSPLNDADAVGNLIGSLEPAQVAGIWLAGDFRVDPDPALVTYALIAGAVLAATGALWLAWRRRAFGPAAYVGGALASTAAIYALGSPWVDAKAMATASPAIVLAALCAAFALAERRARIAGLALAAAVGIGLLWSNALAYRDVSLAPREQLTELEEIGERIAGEGPTLMTEYQPYGARHFLREGDAESVSELRRRRIPLAGGRLVPKGEAADTDALDPGALFAYRTLVLRRSPAQSRPPAAYRLIWRGEFYEAWQRPAGRTTAPPRLALGDEIQASGEADCRRIESLAARTRPGQRLVAAARPPAVVVSLAQASYPGEWATPGAPEAPAPSSAGELTVDVDVPAPGTYSVWVGGSVRPEVELYVDGEPAGTVRHELNNGGQYVWLGEAELEPGVHRVELRFGGPDLHPGSGGAPPPIGPLALTSAEAADAELVSVAPRDARRLCGRAWDWIEVGR